MKDSELRNEAIEGISQADEKLLKILVAVIKEYNDPIVSERRNETSESLYRMVYTSARMKDCSDEDISQILEASRRNNSKLHLSGLLIYTHNRFIQILEGSKLNITSLYERIQKDARHAGTSVRFFEPVAQRQFGEWNMAHKNVSKEHVNYKTDTSEERKALYASLMDGDLSSYKDDGMRVLKTFLLIS